MHKRNNYLIKALFLFLIIILFNNQIFGQKKDNKEEIRFKDRVWYGINVGNIGIFNNRFDINMSLMGGYKITKFINAGLIFHSYYTYAWYQGAGNNKSYFDYGFGALSTVKIYRNFYAQVEVDKMYFDNVNIIDPSADNSYLLTYIGGGYKYSSASNWAMAVSLLYNVNPNTNQVLFPLDYRVAFVYNF
ncbi:MAG: hypothetical protein ACM3PT_03080 [Deltaproteobacteria bacterium]